MEKDLDKNIEKIQNFLKYNENMRQKETHIIEFKEAIDNVLEELEELREDHYVHHQLMRIQNQREYRSKFLKDFKKEFGQNVMPDYDEIYKRYDKQKKEIETKDKAIETWKKIAETFGKSLVIISGEKTSLEELIEWTKGEIEKDA